MAVSWRSQLTEALATYVRRRPGLVTVLVSALGLGVAAGALLASAVEATDRLALAHLVQQLLWPESGEQSLTFVELLRLSLPRYLRLAGLIWLLGVTLVGFVAVPAVLFWRGLVTGFTVGFLIDILGWQGLLLSLAVVVPQNVIALTALMLAGAAAISFSLGLWQQQFRGFGTDLLGYSGLVAVATAGLVIAACLEAGLALIVAPIASHFL